MHCLPQSEQEIAQFLGVSPERLRFFYAHMSGHVRRWPKSKKSGGTRTIVEPDAELLDLLRQISRKLLTPIPLHPYIYHRTGSSYLNLINMLRRSSFILTADINNFYPNITPHKVFTSLQRKGYGLQAAKVFTKLTTFKYQLPQGFPTSPILAAIVIEPTLIRLDGMARAYDVLVGIYADDLVIGAKFDFAGHMPLIKKIFKDSGFEIAKFRAMGNEVKREIMGIELHHGKLRVSKSYLDGIQRLSDELGQALTNQDLFEERARVIQGRISFIESVNPHQAHPFIKDINKKLKANWVGKRKT